MSEAPLCACGCGERIVPKSYHSYHPVKYIAGHSSRFTKAYTPTPEEIPSGLCECGCGKPTQIAKNTYRYKRQFRGHPLPFAPRHGPNKRIGPRAPNWQGGNSLAHGYKLLYMPDHPAADKGGYVPEHRLVMEQVLGRFLAPTEIVHHKNHDGMDNRPDNLMVLSQGQHSRLHRLEKSGFSTMTREQHREAGRKGATAQANSVWAQTHRKP